MIRMKTVRLHAAHDLRLQDESMPVARPGEALVRVKAVGICGSDLHWFGEAGIGDARLEKPLVLGHEFAGEITSGPRSGERVAGDPAIPCNTCEYCLRGDPNLCENMRFAGHGQEDGALREFIAWPAERLFKLPDSLSYADGVMLEPLGVAMHAINLAHLRVGMTVGVFGCGPIGLLIIQLAHLAGALHCLVTEPLSQRLEAAKALGAGEWMPNQSVDVAFEAAGEQAAVDAAFTAVRPGGCVVLAGIPADNQTSFSASVARRKGLTIKMVRRMKLTYPPAIQLVENGKVDVRRLVSHQFPLAEAQNAFALAQRREGLKVIITP